MSEKDYSNIGGSAPTAPSSAAYAGLTGVVQASPPSYFESLGHPIIGASAGVPLAGPQISSYAQQQQKWLANYYTALEASLMDQQSRQFQQQAAISQQQQAAFLQQQAAYIQQQQAAYSQQAAAYSQHPKGVYYQPSPQAVFPPSQSVVVVPNGFDAGARFDSAGRPTIPPPPPGVAPNAAQLAAQAGVNVAMTQKKGSFLSGGSSGGYTFW